VVVLHVLLRDGVGEVDAEAQGDDVLHGEEEGVAQREEAVPEGAPEELVDDGVEPGGGVRVGEGEGGGGEGAVGGVGEGGEGDNGDDDGAHPVCGEGEEEGVADAGTKDEEKGEGEGRQ